MRTQTAVSAIPAGASAAFTGTFVIARIAGRARLSDTAACTAIWAQLREWRRRAVSRRELWSLSRREIADFCAGLTEAEQEARKPFWRA